MKELKNFMRRGVRRFLRLGRFNTPELKLTTRLWVSETPVCTPMSFSMFTVTCTGETSLIPARITFSMIAKLGISGAFSVVCLYTPEVFPTTLRFQHQFPVQSYRLWQCARDSDVSKTATIKTETKAMTIHTQEIESHTTAKLHFSLKTKSVSFRLVYISAKICIIVIYRNNVSNSSQTCT